MDVNISRFAGTLGAYSEQELLRLYISIEDELDARALAEHSGEGKIHLHSGDFAACRTYSPNKLTLVYDPMKSTCSNCRSGRKGRLIKARRRKINEALGA